MASDSNTNCIITEMIEQEIADEYLDDLILNTINTKRKNKTPWIHPPYMNIYIKS